MIPIQYRHSGNRISISNQYLGGTFVPTNIDGCILWLKSDAGITKDGSNRVSLWEDQSDSECDFSQATDVKKFIWTADQLNGYPGLISDGATNAPNADVMSCATLSLTQPFSLFIVFKAITLGEPTINDALFVSNTGSYGVFHDYTPRIALYDGANFPVYAGIDTANFYLWDFVWNGNLTSHFYRNGVDVYTNFAFNTNGIAAPIYLGALNATGTRATNNCFIEIIAYNSVLSDSNREALQNYLNIKYSIY